MPRQATLGYLPPEWQARTTLVVDEADARLEKLYRSSLGLANIHIHPEEIKTIAAKRAWIIRRFGGKILMLDDDLRFAVRVTPDDRKLRQATHDDLRQHLAAMEAMLDDCAHAGWSPRQGNNTTDGGWHSNCRMMFSLGYDADLLNRMEERREIELGRIGTREDMDLTLQLLRAGLPNEVCFDIACDQVTGFGAAGGCSEERTIASSDADAEKLAALHPGLVKVVEKKYEGSINRKEVVVQWKKAYEQSKAR